jgi:EAL domain-containing protein (putative c-di-GMP-specific phosphodiesterase class I)
VQGFVLGRPMPAAEMTAFIGRRETVRSWSTTEQGR